MNFPLFRKCETYDFEKLFKRKGYAYFTKGAYNLNIIGVRSNNGNKVTNDFDDVIVVIYNTPAGKTRRFVAFITTEPGTYYVKLNLINSKGTAILVPGQYRGCWEIAKHKGKYQALCQKKAVQVYRDNNRNDIYDLNPETIENGIFGINIHKSASVGESIKVNKWSAGCQVFRRAEEFTTFMSLCRKQAELYGNSFTYTLIKAEDLI